jgi:hypothetical protein
MSNHSIVHRILEILADFEAGATSAFSVNESIDLHTTALESVPRETIDKLRALGTKLFVEDYSDLEREQMGWEDESTETVRLIREVLDSIAPPSCSEFEKVHVETDWHDGPRAGIASIHGIPHRFKSNFDEQGDEFLSTFLVWPVSSRELELEIEQWGMFVEWNARFESGEAGTDSHPGAGGINARWDEIEAAVRQRRIDVPAGARLATAQFKRIDRKQRYEKCGPDYLLCWSFPPGKG